MDDKTKCLERGAAGGVGVGVGAAFNAYGEDVEIKPFRRADFVKRVKYTKVAVGVILVAAAVAILVVVGQLVIDMTTHQTTLNSDDHNHSTGSDSKAEKIISNSTSDGRLVVTKPLSTTTTTTPSTTTTRTRRTTITTTTATPSTTTTTTVSTTPSTTTTRRTTTTTTATTAQPIIDHLLVTIVVNKGQVPNKDRSITAGQSDAYVKAYVDNQYIGSTGAHKDTLTPVWDYQMALGMTLRVDSVLLFEVYDKERWNADEFIGRFVVKMSDLMAEAANGKQVDREFTDGRLWFTVSWTEVYRG